MQFSGSQNKAWPVGICAVWPFRVGSEKLTASTTEYSLESDDLGEVEVYQYLS